MPEVTPTPDDGLVVGGTMGRPPAGGGPPTVGGWLKGSEPPLADPPDADRSEEADTGGAGVGVEGGAGVLGAEWVAVDAGGYWASLRPDMCGRT